MLVSVCCALLLSACGGTETANNNAATTTNANKSTTTTTTTTSSPSTTSTPATTSSPAATTTGSGEKIGIAECDDFLDKYEACVSDKIPASARAQYQPMIAQWRKSWHDLAANPQTKSTLAAQCKTIAQQYSQTMKPMGCTF